MAERARESRASRLERWSFALAFGLAGGIAIVLPFIVAYTILAYRVFRGKTTQKLYD